jgi:hypothetical protein
MFSTYLQIWNNYNCESSSTHCIENPIYVVAEKELRGLRPNFFIRVSVSDFIFSQDQSTYFPIAE